MADDEMTALDRVRDRLGAAEKDHVRLDERISALGRDKLGKDDATVLMAYAASGDDKLRTDVVGRISDFRQEVRDAFKHNEKETASLIYRATKESEDRQVTQISNLATDIAGLKASVDALLAAQSERQSRGLHPAVSYGGGTGALVTAILTALYFWGAIPSHPGG